MISIYFLIGVITGVVITALYYNWCNIIDRNLQ